MATDVDVQYFSHLNGLTLGNNWGDLIRLLDKALVTGVDFTQITSASIDTQGDVHITLYAAHNAMLFQVVELTGFAPASFNQKYRIKGVPNATQLILKPHTTITETSITIVGAGKLASLGYEIIFRDTNDVKRVYRAKNPTAQHPFIRVDESQTSPDGTTGVYTSTYAKYAMVGLLEHMEHIDDYENPNVLQLPFDPASPSKNWNIVGTGVNVVRGWSRWHWATNSTYESNAPNNEPRTFTLCGSKDAFYFSVNPHTENIDTRYKYIHGCGLYESCLPSDVVPNWFLLSYFNLSPANASVTNINRSNQPFSNPLTYSGNAEKFYTCKYSVLSKYSPSVPSFAIKPDYRTGFSGVYSSNQVSALQMPIYDDDKYLRGALKHIHYSGNSLTQTRTTPLVSGSSMYVVDANRVDNGFGGSYFYLGELE